MNKKFNYRTNHLAMNEMFEYFEFVMEAGIPARNSGEPE